MLISAVQKSHSVVHIYILFHILFYYGLSQDIEYSSLCYTGGPCCLSILYKDTIFKISFYIERGLIKARVPRLH